MNGHTIQSFLIFGWLLTSALVSTALAMSAVRFAVTGDGWAFALFMALPWLWRRTTLDVSASLHSYK